MGLFKKRYAKNVTRDNEFMKNYAIKTHGLLLYAEENEKVTTALKTMMDDLQYTVATPSHDAKSIEKKIQKEFDALTKSLQQPSWEEEQILVYIKNIRRYIVEISAIR
ncbi:MAG: hypothetical protein E7649_07920 [Ruminococcaceae bacterium]|nr:hypothetical protein [Oscillospiraceae bacterium]